MHLPELLAAYVAAVALLTITPGLDTALVLRTATVEGARKAFLVSLGICTGFLTWGAAIAVGLGAILTASHLAYVILTWTGAVYLAWLGAQLLLWPRTEWKAELKVRTQKRDLGWFWRGLTTNLTNPKVGVFYVSFLPQFVPAHVPVAPFTFLLAVIHVPIALFWFAFLARAGEPLGRVLRRPRVLSFVDRLTGAVFIAFGARLAFEQK